MDYLLRDSFYTASTTAGTISTGSCRPRARRENGEVLLGMDRRPSWRSRTSCSPGTHVPVGLLPLDSINFERCWPTILSSGDEYRLPPIRSTTSPPTTSTSSGRSAAAGIRGRRVVERHGFSCSWSSRLPSARSILLRQEALTAEHIEHFEAESLGVLSKYFRSPEDRLDPRPHHAGRVGRIEDYTRSSSAMGGGAHRAHLCRSESARSSPGARRPLAAHSAADQALALVRGLAPLR